MMHYAIVVSNEVICLQCGRELIDPVMEDCEPWSGLDWTLETLLAGERKERA